MEDRSLKDFLGDDTGGTETEEDAERSVDGEKRATDDEEQSDDGDERSADSDGDVATEREPSDDESTGDDGPTEDDGIEPARSTSAWTRNGADCDDCGETVERRWDQDDQLVCRDCKDW